ncbi:MAG: trypsin-like peptidase domain-containing protein [Candidatus Sumerlaeaceae bacterium]
MRIKSVAVSARCTGLLLLAIACVVAPASAQQEATKAGRTILGEQPWTQPAMAPAENVRPHVIYGPDDRHDIYQETNPQRLQLAASTCGLLGTGNLTDNGNGTFTFSTVAYTVSGKPACSGEPYGSQPAAMFCTGFMVGHDLIATAGHCYDASDISSVRFVFGFQMNGVSSPVTTVTANQVYSGVAVVTQVFNNEYDYSIIRVDRKIVSPGAVPLPLRRTGTIMKGVNVGVTGHPSGLPLKIAFGATTRVSDSSAVSFFSANLDAYGGNSGSPVFNAASGVVEGILVRGLGDFNVGPSCFTSIVMPDDPGGEEASKTRTFAQFVTGAAFDQVKYRPSSTAAFHVVDDNLVPATLPLTLSSSSGDTESANAIDPDNDNTYRGSIALSSVVAPVTPSNGILEVRCGDTLTLTYNDTDAGAATPATFTSTALVDCTAPVISGITTSMFQPDAFALNFQTDEPATATLQRGYSCAGAVSLSTQQLGTTFSVEANLLQPCTSNYYRLVAEDEAGNIAVAGNGTDCFTTRTLAESVAFLDQFDPAAAGWTHASSTGSDNWMVRTTPRAVSGATAFTYTPGTSFKSDASLASPPLPTGPFLSFYHTYNFESPNYDGGVLEYRTTPTGNWTDMGSRILYGGYTGVLSTLSQNALAGSPAWTAGTFGSMHKVVVDYSGIPAGAQIRFRFCSDIAVASGGWEIENFKIGSAFVCTAAAQPDWALLE